MMHGRRSTAVPSHGARENTGRIGGIEELGKREGMEKRGGMGYRCVGCLRSHSTMHQASSFETVHRCYVYSWHFQELSTRHTIPFFYGANLRLSADGMGAIESWSRRILWVSHVDKSKTTAAERSAGGTGPLIENPSPCSTWRQNNESQSLAAPKTIRLEKIKGDARPSSHS